MSATTTQSDVRPTADVGPAATRGIVRWFSPKGFGFIARRSGEDVYVHHSAIVGDGFTALERGTDVEFEVRATPRGPEAIDVRPVDGG